MKKYTYLLLFNLVLILLLSGCEKALVGGDPANNPKEVFEHLWNDLADRYSYFELKNIDWEAIKTQYEPRIQEGMTDLELFEVLSELLFELQDGHVNLTSPFNRSRNWDWFQNFPLNYNQGIIDRNYLGTDFWITGALRHQIVDSVLYINYRTFSEEITPTHIDAILARARGLAGIIIDVRSNGGGNLSNAQRLASAFTNEAYTYGQVRIKNGACGDCFSSWTNLSVPGGGDEVFSGDVIVLTNRGSYSSTTYFAEMMKANPRATLLGAPTGGGGGTPVFGELPNGWLYRFSSTQALALDSRHFEIGTPVDIEVALDKSDEDQGIDTIIERAIEILRR